MQLGLNRTSTRVPTRDGPVGSPGAPSAQPCRSASGCLRRRGRPARDAPCTGQSARRPPGLHAPRPSRAAAGMAALVVPCAGQHLWAIPLVFAVTLMGRRGVPRPGWAEGPGSAAPVRACRRGWSGAWPVSAEGETMRQRVRRPRGRPASGRPDRHADRPTPRPRRTLPRREATSGVFRSLAARCMPSLASTTRLLAARHRPPGAPRSRPVSPRRGGETRGPRVEWYRASCAFPGVDHAPVGPAVRPCNRVRTVGALRPTARLRWRWLREVGAWPPGGAGGGFSGTRVGLRSPTGCCQRGCG